MKDEKETHLIFLKVSIYRCWYCWYCCVDAGATEIEKATETYRNFTNETKAPRFLQTPHRVARTKSLKQKAK